METDETRGAEFKRRYDMAMDQASAGFGPLARELERLLEVKTSVDQTGGMIMCLRVPVGREVDAFGDTRRWAWFSELGAGDDVGVGLYAQDEWGDAMGDSEFLEWPGEFSCGGEDALCAWYHHSRLAEQVARWAAPTIVAFAARLDVER